MMMLADSVKVLVCAAIGGVLLLTTQGCSRGGSHASHCSNFANQWVSDNGEDISIVQEGCHVIATNPVEMWSPMEGVVVGDELHMFNITGILNATDISWNDTLGTVWKVMAAPPLQVGLAEARKMLQNTIETEQGVIQPYLSALYSIHPNTNTNAAKLLHGIAVEEMLHMTTASNLLNAIGGHPRMNTESFAPVYPMKLPFTNMTVSLTAFSQSQMSAFRHIEEATWGPDNAYRINTVGVYYFRIGELLDSLVQRYGETAVYCGNPSFQVNSSSSMGTVEGIYNHADGMKFLSGVYMQGEGVKGSLYETSPYTGDEQISHFYRFNELLEDRCYQPSDNKSNLNVPTGSSMGTNWSAAYDLTTNPKAADFSAHPDIHNKMTELNSCYSQLLSGLHDAFNGSPETFLSQIQNMFTIASLAKELAATPHPDKPGMTVGPSWEWVNITDSMTPPCPAAPSAMRSDDARVPRAQQHIVV